VGRKPLATFFLISANCGIPTGIAGVVDRSSLPALPRRGSGSGTIRPLESGDGRHAGGLGSVGGV
jgi:hypothetical protein